MIDWFFILNKHWHPSNAKILIKFSISLLWIKFPKMFYPFFYQFFTFEKPAFGTALIRFTENKKLTEKLRIINQLIRKSLHCIKYVRKRVLSERIFTYKNRIVSDSVLIREFKCQRKPVFLHILCWNVVNLLRF